MCRGLFWIWIDRFPNVATREDVAASAAFTDESGTVDFDAKAAEAAALVDFPDKLAGFGAKPEAAALVDFPDKLEAGFTKTEPAALGATALG